MLEDDVVLATPRASVGRRRQRNRTRGLLNLGFGPEVTEDGRRRRPGVLNVMTATIFRNVLRRRQQRRRRRRREVRQRRRRRLLRRGRFFGDVLRDARPAAVLVVLSKAVPARGTIEKLVQTGPIVQ